MEGRSSAASCSTVLSRYGEPGRVMSSAIFDCITIDAASRGDMLCFVAMYAVKFDSRLLALMRLSFIIDSCEL